MRETQDTGIIADKHVMKSVIGRKDDKGRGVWIAFFQVFAVLW